jgi:hypothetical protein
MIGQGNILGFLWVDLGWRQWLERERKVIIDQLLIILGHTLKS